MRASSPGYAGTETIGGSTDLAQDANFTVIPVSGFTGIVTFAHEETPADMEIRVRDGTTIEKVHIFNAGNYDASPVVITSTRWAQVFNKTAGQRFISFTGLMFT